MVKTLRTLCLHKSGPSTQLCSQAIDQVLSITVRALQRSGRMPIHLQGRGQHPQPHTAVCICMTCDWLLCMPCNVLNGLLLHSQDPHCICMHSSRPLAQQKQGSYVMLLQLTCCLFMRVKVLCIGRNPQSLQVPLAPSRTELCCCSTGSRYESTTFVADCCSRKKMRLRLWPSLPASWQTPWSARHS